MVLHLGGRGTLATRRVDQSEPQRLVLTCELTCPVVRTGNPGMDKRQRHLCARCASLLHDKAARRFKLRHFFRGLHVPRPPRPFLSGLTSCLKCQLFRSSIPDKGGGQPYKGIRAQAVVAPMQATSPVQNPTSTTVKKKALPRVNPVKSVQPIHSAASSSRR